MPVDLSLRSGCRKRSGRRRVHGRCRQPPSRQSCSSSRCWDMRGTSGIHSGYAEAASARCHAKAAANACTVSVIGQCSETCFRRRRLKRRGGGRPPPPAALQRARQASTAHTPPARRASHRSQSRRQRGRTTVQDSSRTSRCRSSSCTFRCAIGGIVQLQQKVSRWQSNSRAGF